MVYDMEKKTKNKKTRDDIYLQYKKTKRWQRRQQQIPNKKMSITPVQNNKQYKDFEILHQLQHHNGILFNEQSHIQVNMDGQYEQFMMRTDRKKTRKKQYKRKKKQKRKQEQQQAKIKLANIIKEIYQNKTNFEKNKNNIETNLNQLVGGKKFFIFLNQTITIHVKNMQQQIWNFMQSIIKQNKIHEKTSIDDQQFYLQMVQYIYDLFCKLSKPSYQIQKIINLFQRINSNSTHHLDDQYQLDKSTFRFMIDTDDTIKNILKICKKRIYHHHTNTVQHIKQLTKMISKSEFDGCQAEDQQHTEKSTSVDDEEEEKQGKKKKRKKVKDIDFCNSPQQVTKRLNSMSITDKKRLNCQATEQWANSLRKRYKQS